MESIDLNKIPVQETEGHTSKGNQLKWKLGDQWYKADHMGYEGLSEVLVSRLLHKAELKYPFVEYHPVEIAYKGQKLLGCRSKNFLKKNQKLIPLEKLYRQNTGKSLALSLVEFPEVPNRIRYTVEQVEKYTGLHDFGKYLTAMLELDAFFLNEDRHTNNIAVLYDTEKDCYELSPIFDQGLSLLADTSYDFSLEQPLEDCIKRVEAKPFHSSFVQQVDAAEELYGIQIHFNFGAKEVQKELQMLNEGYSEEIIMRGAFSSDTGRGIPSPALLPSATGSHPPDGPQRNSPLSRQALNLQTKRLLGRLELPMLVRLTRLCAALYPEQKEEWKALQTEAGTLTAQNACCRVSQLAVNGRDLMAAGVAPGPGLRRVLEALLEEVITGRLPNEKAELLAFAAKFSAA